MIEQPFNIGNVEIRNRAVLAPMSGISDLPFRRLAWRHGAGLVVTEMVASRELVCDRKESWSRLRGEGISPHMVQLAGREARWMDEAARIAEANGADIIDINMGCPAKKVTGGYSGSALMRDLDHAIELIDATVRAVSVPVTVKMRLGWDESSINAPELARRAEQSGARMITVHGRTRSQFYKGRADWAAIRAVREAISVPLVANGDVESRRDMERIVSLSGADAVMVGRGAQGRPWLVGQLAGHDSAPSSPDAILDLVIEHYAMNLEHHGPEVGVRHFRKHLGWYLALHASDCPSDLKARIMTGTDHEAVVRDLRQAFDTRCDGIQPGRAAA
ncbi:tRNA dihydrouridine synthase DusB [Nitratireductor sp. XY-223]|uniref:tRNA dihydrouridine synthase DusB n=1 Tax=Nitratireductor sp. XY-223 TaxID=2561926 RepID=UPI0010AAA1E6|nr:tRNA dihydrouridine synthase DusB [Nitratireductor sp. XY-223]